MAVVSIAEVEFVALGDNLKRRTHNKNFVLMARAKFWDRPLALWLFILISSALLLLSSSNPSLFGGLRTGVSDAVSPLLSSVSQPFQNAANQVRDMSGISEMQAENARLTAENRQLREWYQAAQRLQVENESLRELLNVKVDPERSFVTARVLSDSGSAFVKSLMVKAGVNDGIEKSNAVISGDGLIGRIWEAGKHTSRILLLTDVNSRVPVVIEGTDQHAVLAGTNEKFPVLDHVKEGAGIRDGARVLTSGYGGVFPAGLPIGVVQKGEGVDFRVALFADFEALHVVRIVSEARDLNLKSAQE